MEPLRIGVLAVQGNFRDHVAVLRNLGAEPVCLYNLGGRIFATHDTCTHGQASLADGFIEGEEIECPLHQGRFHIPSGKATAVPCTEDIRCYAVKVENGVLFIGPQYPPPSGT